MASPLAPASACPLLLNLHRSSSMPQQRCVCARVPAVMRTNPSRPKSDARSRTRIPRRASRPTKRVAPAPKSASTKLAPLGKTRAPSRSSPRASCPAAVAALPACSARRNAAVAERRFRRHQRQRVHRIRRKGAPHRVRQVGAGEQRAQAQCRRVPPALENVRATTRLGRRRIQGSTVIPAKSKYASSTSTSVRARRVENARERAMIEQRAGGIVGIGDK